MSFKESTICANRKIKLNSMCAHLPEFKQIMARKLTLIHKMPERMGLDTELGRAVREKQMGPKSGSTSSFGGKAEALVDATEAVEK